MADAGLHARVEAFGSEVDRLLDEIASYATAQAGPPINEAAAIHEAARRHDADRLDQLPALTA